MTIKYAKKYINWLVKEGICEAEEFDGMTDNELIQFASECADREEQYEYV